MSGAGHSLNSDPVTTIATSSSEPVTSPSSASHVPVQTAPASHGAPSSVASQPPASVDGKAGAPDEARTASSASNPQGSEHPGSVDPAATTTAATTSASTTSITSTAATTTTTTTTGTTATGRVSPTIPPETLFHDAIKRCNNCLFLIRKLRNKQDHIARLFLDTSGNDQAEFNSAFQNYKDFGLMVHEVMMFYDKLDHIARHLPKALPPIDNINLMRTLYTQEHTMCHININNLLEKMIDCGNWNEGNFQTFFYLSELLRCGSTRKYSNLPEQRLVPPAMFHSQATNSHAAFEHAFNGLRKEIANKSLGIYPKVLQRTTCSLIIEFLFGCGGAKPGEKNTDKEIVYTIKFLIIERNGSIEYINIMAPTEDWHMVNDYAIPTINPFAPSRYEVYRRLTKQANIHLFNCFAQNRWTAGTLFHFISLYGKFRELFTTKCRSCKQVLSRKNFLPPLIFDIRNPNNAAHEVCR